MSHPATTAGLHGVLRAPWHAARRSIATRAQHWAYRRQGADPRQLTLESRRIYILPTGAGLVYAIMMAVMLAGAMNYNNNLAFALTFLLAALGIVSIFHTHRSLAGLQLGYLDAEPVFAGEDLQVRFTLGNEDLRPREDLSLDWNGGPGIRTTVPAGDSRMVSLPLTTTRRGPVSLPPLRLSSHGPLGLTRAWTWIHLQEGPLAYPRPARRAEVRSLWQPAATLEGRGCGGDDDFAGLRPWQSSDPPRRIAWKRYARSGELLVGQFRGGREEQRLWFDWDALPPGDVETRISLLTRLVIDAFEAGGYWGLVVPGHRLGPDGGRKHLHRCLRCLATAALPVPEP